MASLSSSMPEISLSISDLRKWGKIWLGTVTGKSSKQPNRFDKQQGMHFGTLIHLLISSLILGHYTFVL